MIEKLLKQNISYRKIGNILGRGKSTISDEIKRYSTQSNGYEINYLTDTKKSLKKLKTSIDKNEEFNIKTISKYTLSNYESLPIGESYGIVKH